MKTLFNYNDWPWTEESIDFVNISGKTNLPKVSVIIPSFNQGDYIEETIRSIVNQGYPNLELIIIDGGSTDGTVEIIKEYEANIHYWVSEKDRGQSHAINKGLEKATGEWIAWMNSDDCYLRGAFSYLFMEMDISDYDFIYGNYLIGKSLSESREVKVMSDKKISFSKVIRFFYGIEYIIPSQSVFIKKSLIDKVGKVNEELHYCMDVDWYARIMMTKPKVLKYSRTICFFRHNEKTKTGSFRIDKPEENKMGIEAEQLALVYSRQLGFWERLRFTSLYNYYLSYSKAPWLYDNCSLTDVLKLFLFHPFRSLPDRRVWGLLKRRILIWKQFNK